MTLSRLVSTIQICW